MTQVTLNTIIDINGLIDFHIDSKKEDWGTYPEKRCKADSFCIFIASQCHFTGSTGNIPILEQDCEYTWKVSTLNNESLTLNLVDDENKITLEMVQAKKKEWDEIFVLVNPIYEEDKLIIKEEDPGSKIFKITTSPQTSSQTKINYIKLSYSIEFKYYYDNKYRYFKIDPFIKVRSDDEPEP